MVSERGQRRLYHATQMEFFWLHVADDVKYRRCSCALVQLVRGLTKAKHVNDTFTDFRVQVPCIYGNGDARPSDPKEKRKFYFPKVWQSDSWRSDRWSRIQKWRICIIRVFLDFCFVSHSMTEQLVTDNGAQSVNTFSAIFMQCLLSEESHHNCVLSAGEWASEKR